MKNIDPRIDSYIEKSAEFAKPILRHIRNFVHEVCPDLTETIKWGMPHFDFNGPFCFMASFKEHCAFGLAKGKALNDTQGILELANKSAMGSLGRIRSLEDLPNQNILRNYLLLAMEINLKPKEKTEKKEKKVVEQLPIPDYFLAEMEKYPDVKSNFEKFRNSHKNEYILWLEDAKTEATRQRRLIQTLEWIAEGKNMNWRYEKKK